MKIPDIALEYWGWTHLPAGIIPGMYEIDRHRADSHDEICTEYGLDKEITKRVNCPDCIAIVRHVRNLTPKD